jgi:glycosyltransferase involved in cell wall biosynthesis
MKLFKRQVLKEALERMLVKTYAFDLELLSIAASRGAKIAEAPVHIEFGGKFGCLNYATVRAMAIDTLAVFYRLKLLRYYSKVEVPRPLERNVSFSIVIACPNGSWMLDECLEAISAQTYGDYEVIVLPDGELEISDPRVKVFPTGKVRPAEKRNLGIRMSGGDVVAFIDDDAYPDPHWLEYAARYFSESAIAAVGGPGVTPPGDGFMQQLGGRVYSNFLVSGNFRYRYKAGGVRRDVDDYPSCNLFVRRSVLEKIDGYRTDFWPGEDTLLCKDIVDSGFRIVYDPWVVVYHHRRALFAPHLRQLGRYAFHRGYFVKRYPSNSAHPSYFVPSVFVAGMFFAYHLWPVYVFYLALVLFTSFSLNPVKWLLTSAGVFLTHVVYGVRFAQGLCAKKAPCEYIGKDHA